MDTFRTIKIAAAIAAICYAGELSAAGNVIPVTGTGVSSGTVVGVTNVSAPSASYPRGSANVVIRAQDRFGNMIQRTRTVGFRSGGIAQFGRACIAAPVACAAVAALAAGAAYYGYNVLEGQDIMSGGSVPIDGTCYSEYLERADAPGMFTNSTVIPCYGNKATYDWMVLDTSPQGSAVTVIGPNGPYYVHSAGATVTTKQYVYYSYGYSTAPTTAGSTEPLTDEQWDSLPWVAPDPAQALQQQPGVWPEEIWEPVDWSQEVYDPNTDPVTLPDPSLPEPNPTTQPAADVNVMNWPYPTEPSEPLLDWADVPHDEIDVSNLLNWGAGWMPNTCPADSTFTIMGNQTFTLSYVQICSLASTWLNPFIQIGAMFSALVILLGAVRT